MVKNIEENLDYEGIVAAMVDKYGNSDTIAQRLGAILDVARRNLVSLELFYPITSLYCERNHLTELILVEGMTVVWCSSNKITSLDIPKSVVCLHCDKELFDYDNCPTECVDIVY